MSFAIRVDNLSKSYKLGLTHAGSIRDLVTGTTNWLLGRKVKIPKGNHLSRLPTAPNQEDNLFWALRDVSFEIKQGEVLGVIGRNGAGKSTLLKILSRITTPTSGRALLNGRVASLLEVGTGFHPELTGRENIFLSGSILGMSRAEIRRKFDEIVEFAGVMEFLDTPVKRYSSGMYVRLGFAVAAHLEPEILIVDEVLAVGDAAFQKKCLNKMQDAGQHGRTVLFVSHSMASVARLCTHALWFDHGKIVMSGSAGQVVGQYLQSTIGKTAEREWPDIATAPGDEVVRMRAVRARTEEGTAPEAFDIRRPVGLEVHYDVLQPGHLLTPNIHVYNEEGICVFVVLDNDPAWQRQPRPTGRFVTTVWIPGNFLAEGTLLIRAAITTYTPYRIHCDVHETIAVQIVDAQDGQTARGDETGHFPGVIRPILPWTTAYNDQTPSLRTG